MDESRSPSTGIGPPSDQELVAACLEGDRTAWELLLRRYERMIYSVTVRFGFDLDERHDVFQTVCCEILKNLPSLSDVLKIRSWIITITIRACNDLIREKYKQRQHEPEAAGLDVKDRKADILDVYLRTESEQLVREAIEELPPRCRELIRLLFLNEKKTAYLEVGRQMGLSKETIGSVRQRCLMKLRQILDARI